MNVTIKLPVGYASAEEFARDCGFELAPQPADAAQGAGLCGITDEIVDRALTENVDLIQGYTYEKYHSIRDFRHDPKGPEIWRCPAPSHGTFQKRLAHEKLKAQLIAAGIGDVAYSAWKPIETAPKDGTPVDLFSDSGRRWCNYRWDKDFPYEAWSDASCRERHWRDRPFMYASQVTHWMLTPAAPTSSLPSTNSGDAA